MPELTQDEKIANFQALTAKIRQEAELRRILWDSLPWYTKRWRRLKSRFYVYRQRVVDAWLVLIGREEI